MDDDWNKAIEAAAELSEVWHFEHADEIRKLKKSNGNDRPGEKAYAKRMINW